MKCYYKKDQDWTIKDPAKLKMLFVSNDFGVPEGYIENGIEIWKKGGLNEVKEIQVSNTEPKRAKGTRKRSKKKPEKEEG